MRHNATGLYHPLIRANGSDVHDLSVQRGLSQLDNRFLAESIGPRARYNELSYLPV